MQKIYSAIFQYILNYFTFRQISDVICCEEIIKHYADRNSSLCKLVLKKWKVLKELKHTLKIPYDVTIAFQSSNLTLSDVYGRWLGMQLHFQACIDKKVFKTGLVKNLLDASKIRGVNIFKNPLMSCALYLDPRFRAEITKCEEKTNEAKENLLKIWRRIIALRNPTERLNTTTASSGSDSYNFEFNEQEAITAHLQGGSINTNQQTEFDIEAELNAFNPDELPPNSDILAYWDQNRDHPLYELAMVVYSVPPTEVQIERDFSTLDFIFTKRRGNISHYRLEDIFVLHLNKDLFFKVVDEEMAELIGKIKSNLAPIPE